REGAAVADVAEALGFSDGRSFARAFRGWTGLAPADYRDRHGDI
ncbi:MAG: AraC family transcriptional regulator, partial [Sphingomonadaceae bacterium]|nr:AraC family transcriptional regulator [Sphingomonadaceae bacterium]